MMLCQFAIARVSAQYRGRLLRGETLTPRQVDNHQACDQAVIRFEGLEDEMLGGGEERKRAPCISIRE